MKIKDNIFFQILIACILVLTGAFSLFYFLISSLPQLSPEWEAKQAQIEEARMAALNYGEAKITHYQEAPIYKVETNEGVVCMVLENYPYGGIDCSFPSEK